MKLSEIVSNYRAEHYLTVEEFAERCGLSKGYISMIEREVNPRNNKPISPTFDSIKKIAHGMSMTVNEFAALLDNDAAMNLLKQKMDKYRAMDDHILQIGGYENREFSEKLITAYLQADDDTKKIIRMLLHIDGGEQ